MRLTESIRAAVLAAILLASNLGLAATDPVPPVMKLGDAVRPLADGQDFREAREIYDGASDAPQNAPALLRCNLAQTLETVDICIASRKLQAGAALSNR